MDETNRRAGPPGAVDAMARPAWDLVRLVALVLVSVVVARAIGRTEDVVRLVAFAFAAALLTAPLARLLARRLPRGVAVAVTALVAFLAVVTVAAVVVRVAEVRVGELASALDGWLGSLRPGTVPARVAEGLQLRQVVDESLARLPTSVVTGAGEPVGVARRALDIFLIVILAAFFQASAGALVDRLVGFWPRPARPRLRALLADVEQRAGGHVRRLLALAVVVWAVVTLAAWALDLPGGVLLGVWAAAWAPVPWLGGWVGLAPLVALAASSGRPPLVAAVLVAVAVGAATGRARRRFVERPTLVLGPTAAVLAVAAGLRLGGPTGALAMLCLAAVALALLTSPHLAGANTDPAERRPPVLGPLALVDGHRVRLVPGWRGALTLLAGVALGALVWTLAASTGRMLTWLVVGVLVAVALDRPVAWFRRRFRLPRPAGIGVVCALAAAVIAGALALGASSAVSSSQQVQDQLPQVVSDLQDAPLVGPWLRQRDAAGWVSDQVERLPERLSDVRLADWLPTVGDRLLDLGWTSLLALALLIEGPRIVAGLRRRVPASRRRQVNRLATVSHAAIAGYLAGAALVAGINAAVVFTIAAVIGIALAPVLAVWAFVWNFVPQIGGFMGGFPLVVLALTRSPAAAILAGLAFVSYQFLENHLIQPAVISEAIDVPPWVALLAALAGGAVGGVVGAVVLTPLVGVVRVVVAELRRDDFPGATVRLAETAPVSATAEPAAAAPTGAAPIAPGSDWDLTPGRRALP